jgi:hypothetical protein
MALTDIQKQARRTAKLKAAGFVWIRVAISGPTFKRLKAIVKRDRSTQAAVISRLIDV